MDPEFEEFTEMTFKIASAIKASAPGIQFLVIVTDGELTNMAGNVHNMYLAREMLSNAQEQLALQGLPADDRTAS